MVSTSGAAHEMAPARPASAPLANHADADQPSAARQSRKSVTRRTASDDEILGLESGAAHSTSPFLDAQLSFDFDAPPVSETDPPANGDTERSRLRNDANGDPESLRAILDSNPELRRDRQDASAYRESFATPEDARAATALVSDLNRMDALFFSHRPEDHAELARSIANLDPAAFTSLAQAMAAYSAIAPNGAASPTAITREDGAIPVPPPTPPPTRRTHAGANRIFLFDECGGRRDRPRCD